MVNKSKRTSSLIFSMVFLTFAVSTFAEESQKVNLIDALTEIAVEDENNRRQADLEKWTDTTMITELSKVPLMDDYIKNIHSDFKNSLVNPPNPSTYQEYSIENGQEFLSKVEPLGRTLHNLLYALSEKDFEKYGKLIGMMRDVLYLDATHIPLAIKHDNSRDIYWYELHNGWVEQIEKEYSRLFLSL